MSRFSNRNVRRERSPAISGELRAVGNTLSANEDIPPQRAALGNAASLGERVTQESTLERVGLEDNFAANPNNITNLEQETRIQSVENIAREFRNAFEATEEDIRTESFLFNFYNTRPSIINLEQSNEIKFLFEELVLDQFKENFEQNVTLLSHENYKITQQPTGPIFGPKEITSNGPFIDPSQLFLLKKNYIEHRLNPLKNKFFVRNKYARDNKKTYLNSIKSNNKFKIDYIDKFNKFLDNNKSELKTYNFGNQLIQYAKEREYTNYFGKVSNIIYNVSKEILNTGESSYVSNHINSKYFNLNGNTRTSGDDSPRFDSLEHILIDYFKIDMDENDDQNSILSNSNGDLVNSNVVISKALLNCALSLKNPHEGSFTNLNYNKNSDLNYDIYNTFSSNSILKKIPVLTHTYIYDILEFEDGRDEDVGLNFTSPAFTNTRDDLGFLFLNKFSFKENSIYNLENIYNTNSVQKDHFTNINLLQRANDQVATGFYTFYPDGNRADIFSLEYLLRINHNWLRISDYADNSFIDHSAFNLLSNSNNNTITIDQYLCQKNNLLDVDAIICNYKPYSDTDNSLQLIYFDSESQIREFDSGDNNRIRFLSSPTFNLFSIYARRGAGEILVPDASFQSAFKDEHNHSHNTAAQVTKNNSSIYFKTTKSEKISNFAHENFPRKILLDFLRVKLKSYDDLDRNRILYAHGQSLRSGYEESIETDNDDNLSYFIDRMWSVKSNIRSDIAVDTNHNTFENASVQDYTSINFQKAQMGAGERFQNLSAGEKPEIKNEEIVPSIMDKSGFHPFVMVKNTNKSYRYDTNILKEKYLKDTGNTITTADEDFYERVEISSSSRRKYKKDEDKNIFKLFNTSSCWGNQKNNWIKTVFQLKRLLFELKSEKLGENQFFNFLQLISEKSKEITRNHSGTKKGAYSFVHADSNSNSKTMFSLEESPFLYNTNEIFVDINNYSESYSDNIVSINNALNQISNAEIESLLSFSEKDSLKSFLEVYYPESCLKNSSNLFYRFIYDIQSVLEKYSSGYVSANKDKFGFEKLLVDSLVKKQTFTYFLYSIIENSIKNRNYKDKASLPKTFFDVVNKDSNDLYDKYLTSVFSYENVAKQSTFTLRTIHSSFLKDVDKDTINGLTPVNGDRSDGMGFVQISGGEIKNFIFPNTKYITKFNPANLRIFSISHSEEDKSDQGQLRIQGFKKDLALFFIQNTYNYDVYLDKGNESNENLSSLFSKDNISNNSLNAKINYIVLPEEPNKIGVYNGEEGFRNAHQELPEGNADREIKNFVANVGFVGAIDKNKTADDIYDRISGNLFYEKKETVSYAQDLTYTLMEEEGTFINKLSNLILNFITYCFDVEEIKNQSTIDTINSNKEKIEKIHKICNMFIQLYQFEHERIKNLSLHRSIELEVKVQNDNNDEDNSSDDFWGWDKFIKNKIQSSYASILNKFNDNDKDYDINSNLNTFKGNRFVSNDIYNKSKQNTDNFNILNLLNKSDYLESISYDIIFAYLCNFEDNMVKILDSSEDVLNAAQEISDMSEEINEIEKIPFNKIATNKLKLCKISKLMKDEKFYSKKKEDIVNIRNLRSGVTTAVDVFSGRGDFEFNSFNIFKTNIDKEEYKMKLANAGLEIFVVEDGLEESFNKIDILRFGIPYNLANSLSNDKIMSIIVYPVNHKYPEIEFEAFEFLYTPVLTDVTSSALAISRINENNLMQYFGVYDIFNQKFEDKYRIYNDNAELHGTIAAILINASNRREVLGFRDSLESNFQNVNRILTARRLSNSIKYLNEAYNSVFDDTKINRLDIDFDNIISEKTKAEFDIIDSLEYKKIFDENKKDTENYFVEEVGYFNIEEKNKQIEKNIHSIEFFNQIDKDISNQRFLKSLTTDAFFDIFSIRITKEALRKKIKSDLSDSTLRYILQDKDDFSNSYSYTIQTKIY